MHVQLRTLLTGAPLGAMLLCLALFSPAPLHAGVAVESNDLLQFEYQQAGANEEEAVRLAGIRAVHATIGRLLFSDYSIQARDVLGPYIQKNWDKFVASSYVLERRFERDGFGARIRVQTFPEKLHRDLREKKFLFKPTANPYFYAFISGTVDGQLDGTNSARQGVIEAILSEGGKAYESGVQSPPDNSDLLIDRSLLGAGLEAATRIGAEIVVTGRANSQLVDRHEIYYSIVNTYETSVHLDLIKVDNGQLLASADITQRASNSDPAAARDESIRLATLAAMREMLPGVRKVWRETVVDKSKFSLMFTDLSPEEVNGVTRHIEKELNYGTKVRLKSYFGNVAVLNVDTDRAFAAVERAVQNYHAFDLRITDRQGNRITVDVKH